MNRAELLNHFRERLRVERKIQQGLAQTTPCGLAIATKLSNSMAVIDVSTKFGSTVNGSFTVSAYLVNDMITSSVANYGQANNFNGVTGHPYYGMGNPILPYTHRNVVCKTLNNMNGGKVNMSAQVIGGVDVQKFSCDIQSQMSGDCYVIAYITNNATREVINVQKVKLGLSKNWD